MASRTVYGVSVDSRSRNVDECDNRYTINLSRTLDRIKTVQLGSFQFQDCRTAFDQHATLNYSEPLPIPVDTYLRFEETVTTVTKTTRTRTQSVRRVAMLLPPTMNPITSIAGNVVTTSHNTGLWFGTTFYPEVGLRMSVTGADFPPDLAAFVTPTFPTDAGPILTSATIVSPTSSNSFTYAPNYLNELSGGNNTDARHFSDGAYRSYVHAPKPTLVELFTMLNVAAAHLTTRADISDTITGATHASPIVITTTTPIECVTGDEVVVEGVTGNTAANGTWMLTRLTSTSFQLEGSIGNGSYEGGGALFSPQQLHVPVSFGFDNNDNTIVAFAPTRVIDTPTATVTRKLRLIGSLAALLGFHNVNLDPPAIANVPPTIIRPVDLKNGTLLASEIRETTVYRMNAGDFTSAPHPTDRTLHFICPVGTAERVVVDYGRYTGSQLAAYLTARLHPAPHQITVTYNATSGTFTFAHNVGLVFGLDFAASSELMRHRLGFDAHVYTGSTSYTSVHRAVYGAIPENDYAMTLDSTNRHFTFAAHPPLMLHTISGTSSSNVDAQWSPLVNNALPFAHTFQPGDILTAVRPHLSSTQTGTKPITGATNAVPIVITAAAHGLAHGDNITLAHVQGNTAANGTWTVANNTLNTFELVGSIGNGSYAAGSGEWWSNVTSGVPSPLYTVVVAKVWDASSATPPRLDLEPTASIFSDQDGSPGSTRGALGTPGNTDARIILCSARRNVFMLHFEHPDGAPHNFGFPTVAWPPSEKAGAGGMSFRSLPGYDAATRCIPVSCTYTAPFTWNLLPPDYIIIVLRISEGEQDVHTHSYRGTSIPIFAKLLLTYPYVNITDEMLFTNFAGHARFKSMVIEFQNPDGTLVNFNGRSHTFTLLFTVDEDRVTLPCV